MNYERDIHIDESALDVEWLMQAELAVKYGYYWAQCRDRFIRAEENIKVIRAELIAKVNENPDYYLGKGVKPTAPNVEAFYRRSKRHKEAKEEWMEAMRAMNEAEIVKNEISFTRKAALENLVQLHGQNYFAGPKTPRNLQSEREKQKEKRKIRNRQIKLNN